MERVFLGLGSNLGQREFYLQQAREALASLPLKNLQASQIYESLPLANMDQPLYLNQVVCGQTGLSPEALLQACLEIEQQLGRVRRKRWGPRIIDIDLLSLENHQQHSPQLTIPHPELEKRSFVLLPMLELDPTWRHPISRKSIGQLWEQWLAQQQETLPRVWEPCDPAQVRENLSAEVSWPPKQNAAPSQTEYPPTDRG